MRGIIRFTGAAAMCALIQGGAVAATASQAVHPMGRNAMDLQVRNDTVTSGNWSGYGVQASNHRKFTYVQGSWVEPTATCGNKQQYAAFWVGIDGYQSQSVEQLGSDSDCEGSSPSYYAWWEMYPAYPVTLSFAKYPVQPGDTLTASVSVSGTQYTLSMTSSRGWKFSKTVAGSASLKQSSAEWIAEAPASASGILPLADFGTVSFTGCTATVAGGNSGAISRFTASGGPHALNMETPNGTPRATPSALTSSGKAFTVTWEHH